MTNGNWHGRAPARTIAAVAVALFVAPLTASAASGGTITFIGAITAPPLQISAAPMVSAMRLAATNAQAASQGAGVAVSFNAAPGVLSGADVALQPARAAPSRDAVAARFVDSGGRVVAAHDGHYRVGRDGGVLSLSPKASRADTPVIVVVSYD